MPLPDKVNLLFYGDRDYISQELFENSYLSTFVLIKVLASIG